MSKIMIQNNKSVFVTLWPETGDFQLHILSSFQLLSYFPDIEPQHSWFNSFPLKTAFSLSPVAAKHKIWGHFHTFSSFPLVRNSFTVFL